MAQLVLQVQVVVVGVAVLPAVRVANLPMEKVGVAALPVEGDFDSLERVRVARLPVEGAVDSLPVEGTVDGLPVEGVVDSLSVEETVDSLPVERVREAVLPADIESGSGWFAHEESGSGCLTCGGSC